MNNLIYEKHDSEIGILKINRPKVLNALNRATLEELLHFLQSKALYNQCRALIFTGAGDKSFIAGADIKEMQEMSHVDMLSFCELGQEVTLAFEKAPCLVIAAINGYALGGGFEMALGCDFIYASQNAKLGFPEVSLGIIPGFGGTQRLPRIVGERRAKELIMSGQIMGAKEAASMGIINKVCDEDQLIKECYAIALKITSYSAAATLQAKRAIHSGYQLPLNEALELERNMCAVCFATEGRKEEMENFVEKHEKR